MKSLFPKQLTIVALVAAFFSIGWTAVTEEQYFSQPQHFNGTVYTTVPQSYSHNTSAITAHAGGLITSATALTKEYNVVSVVATAADSVKLPIAYAGAHVVVRNSDSADTLAVFPVAGSTIDAGSASASVSIVAGATVEFWGLSATAWGSSLTMCVASGAGSYSTLAASGTTTLSGANLTLASVSAGVTAATGSSQGDGVITTLATQVTTSAVSGDAQTLPTTAVGRYVFVCNAAASNPIDVFPASGSQINKETANVAISLAAGECMTCIGFSTTRWGCNIGSAN